MSVLARLAIGLPVWVVVTIAATFLMNTTVAYAVGYGLVPALIASMVGVFGLKTSKSPVLHSFLVVGGSIAVGLITILQSHWRR
jgi:hypothetical protein